MNTLKTLVDMGLSQNEAQTYQTLLENGILPASAISKSAGIGRTLVYRDLLRLQKLGLVERKEQKEGVALFLVTHPSNLNKLLSDQEESVRSAKNSLSQVMGKFVSDYNSLGGRPNVKFYEDVSGLQRLYDDIIETKEDLLLIRSPLDKKNDTLKDLLEKQIQRQVRSNIKVKALTPLVDTTARSIRNSDGESHLVSRCIIADNFDVPAQILIYGNKVGIVSLKKSLMITIIENDDIAETFKILFEKIWTLSLPENDKIREDISLRRL